MRPRAAVDQTYRAIPRGRGPVLWAVVVAVAAIDVIVILQALFPAVKGFRQGSAFNLNVHPVAVGTGGHGVMEGEERTQHEQIIS